MAVMLCRATTPLDIDVWLYGRQVGVYGSVSVPRAEILKYFCLMAFGNLSAGCLHRTATGFLSWQHTPINRVYGRFIVWQQRALTPPG